MCAPASAAWVMWSGLRIEAASTSVELVDRHDLGQFADDDHAVLVDVVEPTDERRHQRCAGLGREQALVGVKIRVQLVLMPSSAKRLIASRPFSVIATLTTMFGASLA